MVQTGGSSSSGGDKTLQLHLLSLTTVWTDPQDAIKVMGNSASSDKMMEKHVNGDEVIPFKPSQRFHKRWLQDQESAKVLGMTHSQYYSARYQAESIIKATGSESDHLYGNQYDPNLEIIEDLVLLPHHNDQWCDTCPKSHIIGKISDYRQKTLHDAVRELNWNKIRNKQRQEVTSDSREPCSSLDLMNNLDKPQVRKVYVELLRAIKSAIQLDHHEFDSIQVNLNEEMLSHQDKLNQGPSLCFTVGYYSGGELVIDEPSGRQMHNIKGRILRYSGHHPHHVNQIRPMSPETSNELPMERFNFVLYKRKTDAPQPSAPITSIHLQLETSFDPEETDGVIEQAELSDLRSIPEDQRPAMMDAIIKEINSYLWARSH